VAVSSLVVIYLRAAVQARKTKDLHTYVSRTLSREIAARNGRAIGNRASHVSAIRFAYFPRHYQRHGPREVENFKRARRCRRQRKG